MNLKAELERRLSAALAACGAPAGSPAMVAPAARAEFGDYQANGAMSAAKAIKVNPRQLADRAAAAADLSDLAEKIEVAGPGFINITLRSQWLADRTAAMLTDDRLGAEKPARPQTVVVDYSHPNIAREMHVGHLRSTIIGDAMVRVLEFLGHHVIRQNHVGDWGTQFGFVILGLWHICMTRQRRLAGESNYLDRELPQLKQPKSKEEMPEALVRLIRDRHEQDWINDSLPSRGDGEKWFGPFVEEWLNDVTSISFEELQDAYVYVTLVTDSAKALGLDIETREKNEKGDWVPLRVPYASLLSRIAKMVQRGGDDNQQERRAWEKAKKISEDACQKVYDRLRVLLTPDDIRGESAYNADLPSVVADLDKAGLLRQSQGAQCVFLPQFRGKDGEPLPLIVQKTDEGYLYATTDLAAIRYRVGTLKADRILYVTDSRQTLHFQQVFAVARAAGFAPPNVSLERVAFGMMLGADGRPFKTREGGTVKLMGLLDEAEDRAFALVSEKNPNLGEDQRRRIARAVGIGAVKYADLAQNRTSDYVFSWDKMLSLEGNTAPYMQYAYARICSIFRRGGLSRPQGGQITIADPAERALALKLVQFPEAIATVASECLPNVLCAYLYDLAGEFMGFYESCPVLQSQEPLRSSRLRLCELTARTMRTGLDLLGIETLEEM